MEKKCEAGARDGADARDHFGLPYGDPSMSVAHALLCLAVAAFAEANGAGLRKLGTPSCNTWLGMTEAKCLQATAAGCSLEWFGPGCVSPRTGKAFHHDGCHPQNTCNFSCQVAEIFSQAHGSRRMQCVGSPTSFTCKKLAHCISVS